MCLEQTIYLWNCWLHTINANHKGIIHIYHKYYYPVMPIIRHLISSRARSSFFTLGISIIELKRIESTQTEFDEEWKIEVMKLEERMNKTLQACGFKEWTVVWTPSTNKKHGEIILQDHLIVIYDEIAEVAWESFIHEFLELKFRPVLNQYRRLVNLLIELFEKTIYERKEELIEGLPEFFLQLQKHAPNTLENEEGALSWVLIVNLMRTLSWQSSSPARVSTKGPEKNIKCWGTQEKLRGIGKGIPGNCVGDISFCFKFTLGWGNFFIDWISIPLPPRLGSTLRTHVGPLHCHRLSLRGRSLFSGIKPERWRWIWQVLFATRVQLPCIKFSVEWVQYMIWLFKESNDAHTKNKS